MSMVHLRAVDALHCGAPILIYWQMHAAHAVTIGCTVFRCIQASNTVIYKKGLKVAYKRLYTKTGI